MSIDSRTMIPDVTRSRFRRYGRQVEEFNTRQNEQSMWQIRSPRPKSAMSGGLGNPGCNDSAYMAPM